MLGYPYLLLKQRLLDVEGIPQVLWYNAQYVEGEAEPQYFVPCVYLEFLPVPTDQHQQKLQSGIMQVRVHLLTEYMGGEDEGWIRPHYALAGRIFNALSHAEFWLSELPEFALLANTDNDRLVVNQMVRTNVLSDHSQSQTIITIQEFEARIVDVDAAQQFVEVNAPSTTVIRPTL